MNEVSASLKRANGEPFSFPQGRHNSLIVDTLEVLVPHRVPDSVLLYARDKGNDLFIDERAYLERLGVPRVSRDYPADIVLYQPQHNRLYFLYAINCFGTLFEHRKSEMEVMLKRCNAERVYVTVLYNRTDYFNYSMSLAWHSQVWLADRPDHMILIM